MMKAWEMVALGAPFLVAVCGWYALRAEDRPRSRVVAVPSVLPQAQRALDNEEGAPSEAVPTPAVAVPAPRREEVVMGELRRAMTAAPELAIAGAREADLLFPDSPSAAERGWLVTRAFVNLGLFHDARAEAARLVAEFPGSDWALDAEKHLLTHPLDRPSREEEQAALEAP